MSVNEGCPLKTLKSGLLFFPREARLINLSDRAEGPSGAKPRQFERKIYLYIDIYIYISELIFQKVATEIEHILRLSKLKEYASH